MAAAIADGVSGVGMDRDMVIAGAILHDIGKAVSFEKQGFSFISLPVYSLIGHTSLGIRIVEGVCSEYRLPGKDVTHLLHIIQSGRIQRRHGRFTSGIMQAPPSMKSMRICGRLPPGKC
jgi:3'-5' exoribonuclease